MPTRDAVLAAVGTLRFARPALCCRLPHIRLGRNDRQQHIVRVAGAGVQRRGAGEDFRRPVDRIVVQERPAP